MSKSAISKIPVFLMVVLSGHYNHTYGWKFSKVKWECIKNTYPRDTAGAIGSKAKSKVKKNLSITLKTVSKTTPKN